MSDIATAAGPLLVNAGPTVGNAIDWVYVHRDQIQWAAGVLGGIIYGWLGHSQPAKVYDAGGLFKFVTGLFSKKAA